ncbi:hypothetical protein [Desertivirga brevis]|uniref:hypothetical protein n=1 Tax=Desertivirga brevis TaxID=2810310 RepID=UPI001A96A755|nr:hypothetical protein [Pedobacter sp. SYSU D00873]
MNTKSFTLAVLFSALLISFKASKAQNKNFEKAYFINKTDTISGYILRDSELGLSKSFYFKKNLSDEKTLYTPNDVEEFTFASDSITFRKILFRLNPQDTISDPRFAKVLVKGNTDLYKLQLSQKELKPIYLTEIDFVYVLRKGEEYFALSQEETMIDTFYSLRKKYTGLLRALFSDCEKLATFDFDAIPFEDRSIIEITQKYNSCLAPNEASKDYNYKVKAVSKRGVELQAGMFLPKNITNYLENSSSFSIGYFWDIFRKDKSKLGSIRTGINYMYVNYNYEKHDFVEHFLRFPFYQQLNFRPFTSKVIPFVDFGLTPILSTNNKFEYLDIIPFVELGGGIYVGRLRFSTILTNTRVSLKADKLLSIGVAWTLHKQD